MYSITCNSFLLHIWYKLVLSFYHIFKRILWKDKLVWRDKIFSQKNLIYLFSKNNKQNNKQTVIMLSLDIELDRNSQASRPISKLIIRQELDKRQHWPPRQSSTALILWFLLFILLSFLETILSNIFLSTCSKIQGHGHHTFFSPICTWSPCKLLVLHTVPDSSDNEIFVEVKLNPSH